MQWLPATCSFRKVKRWRGCSRLAQTFFGKFPGLKWAVVPWALFVIRTFVFKTVKNICHECASLQSVIAPTCWCWWSPGAPEATCARYATKATTAPLPQIQGIPIIWSRRTFVALRARAQQGTWKLQSPRNFVGLNWIRALEMSSSNGGKCNKIAT